MNIHVKLVGIHEFNNLVSFQVSKLVNSVVLVYSVVDLSAFLPDLDKLFFEIPDTDIQQEKD